MHIVTLSHSVTSSASSETIKLSPFSVELCASSRLYDALRRALIVVLYLVDFLAEEFAETKEVTVLEGTYLGSSHRKQYVARRQINLSMTKKSITSKMFFQPR